MNISHGCGHLWRDECQTECRSSEAAFSNCPSDKMPQPASVTDVSVVEGRASKKEGIIQVLAVHMCVCVVCIVYDT